MEETKKDWHLYENDFFSGLVTEKNSFMSLAKKQNYKKKSILFLKDELGNSCFYVQEGIIKIYNSTVEGKEPIFFLRKKGDMFGIADLVNSEVRKANAETLTSTTVWKLGKVDFETLLDKHHLFSKRIIQVLGKRIRYLGQTIENLMVCDVATRLAKLLVYLTLDVLSDQESWESPTSVPISLTQEQMADMTGSCQQTISETLKCFQDKGMIKMDKKRIIIHNPLSLLSCVRK
ncbi:MAG: Crp/Fnr family transcriptional regulator [Deltaproteobacteria bacterium]|jgi:CRP/FNR family transcriptional regulator, cyclic AMP receptor protein|nr:Crp/Fnr family transcriptional regulator [Deltaproteobacteria bacterium]MBT4526683.1 Crp/Fnr family transcriptional regulator [Deltaproteobacteria bacterium]